MTGALRTAGILAVLPVAFAAGEPPPAKAPAVPLRPAVLVYTLNDCKDIMALKANGERQAWVAKDTGTELVYGRFADDQNPQNMKPWEIYDILYKDVPSSWESGLCLLAGGEPDKAREFFQRSGGEKTPGGLVFSDTPACKNQLDEKLLLCALATKDDEAARRHFQAVEKNRDAHAWVRVMVQYVSFLNRAKDGVAAQKVADDLLKLPLPTAMAVDVGLERCMALAHQKKFPEAKDGIKKLVDANQKAIPGLAERGLAMTSDIVIYLEKNYDAGIRMYQKLMAESKGKPSIDAYMKLGECHFQNKQPAEARWNYIQAYLLEFDDESRLAVITDRLRELNKTLPGGAEMDSYLQGAKAVDEKKKK